MPVGRILLAEDDMLLSQLIVGALQSQGWSVEAVSDGAAAAQRAANGAYALLILDRQLPGLDGLSVLTRVRAHGIATPALFLTALGAFEERVRGLDAGADDYVVKPFDVEELVARVRAIMRRPALIDADHLKIGELSLDLQSWRASFRDAPVILTAQDMLLLSIFARRPNQVFTRDALLTQLSASDDIAPAAVEHAISRLRKKLESAGVPDPIETVRGVGYRLQT